MVRRHAPIRMPRPSIGASRRTRNLGLLLTLVSLLLAACGTPANRASNDGVAAARFEPKLAAETLAAPTTTVPPEATTTIPDPLARFDVLVAIARPEIKQLTVFDAPNGKLVRPEIALVNPWYFGGELAVVVTSGAATDPWVQVSLPGRPNGSTAWIRTIDVTFRTHRFHIAVSIGERRLRAWNADTLLLDEPVVVGRDGTPTPLGRFYINANIPQRNAAGAYGPLILSVSAFSEVLASFDGGLPEIGIHGTNQPALLGQAQSNGCIRMANDTIVRLAAMVPVGTPVDFVV